MHKTPSALFTGSTKDLDYMYQKWMGRIPKIVKTLDYVGYDRETGAYVYLDYAVESGKLLNLNKESFFQLKKSGIKTMVDIKQKLNTQTRADWLTDYQTAFGIKGMAALSWWIGCLFVEQIRQRHRSYPFFEVVGEAGSGKSDMVDFLWKLLGREGESFNPNSSTLAGRTRKMAEVSNLPVVFNEIDNEIWIGTSEGITRSNPLLTKFYTFPNEQLAAKSTSYLNDKRVFAFYKDSYGQYWLGNVDGHFKAFINENKTI